ncbi:MAG: hypothetical protein ACE5EL_04250 [Anaerolineae bacterium]
MKPGAPGEAILAEAHLAPLLAGLLRRARLARHTPLHFDIPAEAIARAAAADFATETPAAVLESWGDWGAVTAALTDLVWRRIDATSEGDVAPGRRAPATAPPAQTPPAIHPGPTRGVGAAPAWFLAAPVPHPLATWLEEMYEAMRAVDPAAIDIVTLRAQAYGDRDIAGRLDLGLRLLRRVLADLRQCRRGPGAGS